MKIFAPLCVGLLLAASSAFAQDVAPSYAVPGYPTAPRAPVVVSLCASSDGSNTTVPCSSGGSVSITGPLPAGSNLIGTVMTRQTSGVPYIGLAHEVVTGGTPVTVFAANSILTQGFIYNSSASPIYVSPVAANPATAPASGGATDGVSVEIPPGGSWSIGPNSGTVTVNCYTGAVYFVAYRY